MRVELARVQLRGVYAVAAGFLLLLGIPLYQAILLAPAGYIEATDPVVSRGDFGPLLLWTSQHAGVVTVFHVIEIVPFVLALGLPFALRRVLWPAGGGRTMLVSGVAGFACYALAIAVGIVAGLGAASSYAANPHSRAAIARGFEETFAFTTLLSQVIGGLLVALFVALVCLRMIRTHTLLAWIGYFGLLLAVLLGLTAIQFTSQLTQAATTLSPFSFATLALWLVCIGVQLASLRRLPEVDVATPEPGSSEPGSSEPGSSEPGSSEPAANDSDASRRTDGDPSPQSAGQ